jgi:hypothetical protein
LGFPNDLIAMGFHSYNFFTILSSMDICFIIFYIFNILLLWGVFNWFPVCNHINVFYI